MKILSASVHDPRRGGEYRNPFLVVEVDEDVREISPAKQLGDGWMVTPYGPFVAVDNLYEKDDLGTFNTMRLWKTRLVEVEVISEDEEIDLAMPIDRARRLLRKHDLDWRFVLDDLAGQHGKLQWRLMGFGIPICTKCEKSFREEVYYRGTYLPLCAYHLSEHNKMIRNLRHKTA